MSRVVAAGSLKISGPFNLEHTLYSGQAFRWRAKGGWHWGVVRGNLVRVRQIGQQLEWEGATAGEAQLEAILGSYFRLGDNLDDVYARIGDDERIACAIDNYHGMRLLEQEPWECLVSYLCSINNSVRQISNIVERLSECLGSPVTLGDETRCTFAAPQALADAGEGWLRGKARLGFRARYIAGAAEAVACGKLDLEGLKKLPYDEAKQRLLEIDGVGDKVADCVLVFSLRKMEAFPVDRWVRRAVLEGYFDGKRMSDREIRAWARERFGEYAGYAQQYLFHSQRLEGSMVGEQHGPHSFSGLA